MPVTLVVDSTTGLLTDGTGRIIISGEEMCGEDFYLRVFPKYSNTVFSAIVYNSRGKKIYQELLLRVGEYRFHATHVDRPPGPHPQVSTAHPVAKKNKPLLLSKKRVPNRPQPLPRPIARPDVWPEAELEKLLNEFFVPTSTLTLMPQAEGLLLSPYEVGSSLQVMRHGRISNGVLYPGRHYVVYKTIPQPRPFRTEILKVFVWPDCDLVLLRMHLRIITFGNCAESLIRAAQCPQTSIEWARAHYSIKASEALPDRIYVNQYVYFIDSHLSERPYPFDTLRRIHGHRFLGAFLREPQNYYLRARRSVVEARKFVDEYFSVQRREGQPVVIPKRDVQLEPELKRNRAYIIVTSKFPEVAFV